MWLALPCLLTAPLVSAQEITSERLDEWKEALVAELEDLIPVYEAANERYLRDREERVSRFPLDSFTIGTTKVIAGVEDIEQAIVLVTSARRKYADWAGFLEPAPLVVLFVARTSNAGDFPWDLFTRRNERVLRVVTRSWETSTEVLARVARELGRSFTMAMNYDLNRWFGSSLIPSDGRNPNVKRLVVTAPYTAVRNCYAGSVDSCRQAFGLVDDTGLPPDARERWLLYFEEEDIPVLAGREFHMCGGGSMEGCLALLPPFVRYNRLPMPASARLDLLMFALSLGGEGSLARFSQQPNIESALEAASSTDTENLLELWLTDLISQEHELDRNPIRSSFAAIGWISLLLLGVARSATWK